MLDKKFHLDEETGCRCRYVRSDTEYFRPHSHNFYEVFLMIKGCALHRVNGKEEKISEGQLLFIRDFDIHDYSSVDGSYFEFVNLAFSRETLNSLYDYLGKALPIKKLVNADFPPTAFLSNHEKEKLFFALTNTIQSDNKETVILKTRMLIAEIFTSYFLNFSEKNLEIPLWLEITVEKMKNPNNFILGTERMFELANKSREHTSRSMKRYYNTTVSNFVNDLKLNYSAKLLLSSNLSVIDIAYESGFENISWFYKMFEKKYKITPHKYRKK